MHIYFAICSSSHGDHWGLIFPWSIRRHQIHHEAVEHELVTREYLLRHFVLWYTLLPLLPLFAYLSRGCGRRRDLHSCFFSVSCLHFQEGNLSERGMLRDVTVGYSTCMWMLLMATNSYDASAILSTLFRVLILSGLEDHHIFMGHHLLMTSAVLGLSIIPANSLLAREVLRMLHSCRLSPKTLDARC